MLTVITPASDRKLAALADLQAEISGLSDDVADDLLKQASAAIESACGRVIVVETVEEIVRPQTKRETIILERRPVEEIVSVIEDGVTLSASDYEFDDDAGLVYRLEEDRRTDWKGAKMVVRYRSGFDPVPDDLKRATLTLATALHAARGVNPLVRSETSEGVRSVSYFDPSNGGGAIPATVMGLLAPYVESSL